MDRITVIKSTNPSKVCKTYKLDADGRLEKSVIANTTEGVAVTLNVPTAQAMVKVLTSVTSRDDLVICPGIWRGAEVGEKFRIVSEGQLAEMFGSQIGKVNGGLLEHDGEKVAARLKRGIDNSSWMLLDADNPPGMPEDWAAMTIAERLELWEPFVPGISQCERIELRGSSARVSNTGDFGQATHAWIRVSHPERISLLKANIRVKMVLHGAAFKFKKMSRIFDDKVVGIEDRSVFDLAVLDTGRLVFCAQPEVDAAGYEVADPAIKIVNEGQGALDISWVGMVPAMELERLRSEAGVDLNITQTESGNLNIREIGKLTMDTEIESKGAIRPLESWVAGQGPGFHLRCEAPFRVSQSEAAFIKIGDNGLPFVHDIGNGTTYTLDRMPAKNDFEVIEGGYDHNKQVGEKREDVTTSEPTGGWFDWTYLKARSIFRNIQTGEECKTDAFNLAFGSIVPEMPAANGRTYRPTASKYLLNELQVRQAHDVMYWPKAAKFGMFFEHDQISYVNSYLPNKVPKADPDWQNHHAWGVILSHLQQILPDDWEMMLRWMAHNVQYPGEKILWSPIIKGIPGDGKTTIYRIMMAVMGEKNVREISTQELTSEFNAWAEGACVAVLEEIRIKGHNRYDAMNKLKPVVTNTTVSVVKKGRDGYNIPNCTNYMALTNHEDALALDDDDRRWGVFFTKYQSRDELLAETDKAYWDRLHSAYQDHPGVIRGWLESIDLSGFDCNAAPAITKAKARMIALSRGDAEAAVIEAIELGGFGISKTVIVTDCLNAAIKDHGGHMLQSVILYKVMLSLGFERVEKTFKWKNKVRRIYVHKSRPEWLDPDDLARAEIRELLDKTAEEFTVPF
jgi:hypothetical protein